jgi:hypothetical protein
MDSNLPVVPMMLGLAAAALVWIVRQVSLPRKEWRQIMGSATAAFALGRSGRTDDGYELLRAALREARDRRDSLDEPWAEDLVRALQQALDRYVSRYGTY